MKVFYQESIDPDCSHVCLKDFDDGHLSKEPLVAVTHLMLYRCDKNFVYYNTKASRFPNLKKLWVFSHPCGGGGAIRIREAFPDIPMYARVGDEKYYGDYDDSSTSSKITYVSFETMKLIVEPLLD